MPLTPRLLVNSSPLACWPECRGQHLRCMSGQGTGPGLFGPLSRCKEMPCSFDTEPVGAAQAPLPFHEFLLDEARCLDFFMGT